MFLLFFAENIGIMRKMRISVNYADPHRRILSDAMELHVALCNSEFGLKLIMGSDA